MFSEEASRFSFRTDFDRKSFYQQQQTRALTLLKQNPELEWMLIPTILGEYTLDPKETLQRCGLPEPTLGFRSQIRPGTQATIDPTLIKDGEIYLLHGNHPGLSKRGIYSLGFVRWLMTLDQFLQADGDSPPLSHWNFHPQKKLEQFMWQHSLADGEAFVSATPNHEIARKYPDFKENSGSVYVIRMPLERVIRNYASIVDGAWREDEHLITDYVLPEQIIAELDPRKNAVIDPRAFIL